MNAICPFQGLCKYFEDNFICHVSGKTQNKMAPNHESYLLWASSDDERKDWIQIIRKVMYSSVGGGQFNIHIYSPKIWVDFFM